MAYSMLMVTQTLSEEQPPGIAWVVGCVAVCAGYLLLRLRTYLIKQDMVYLKVRLAASEDGEEDDDEKEGEHKTRHSLRTKMNNIYLSMTIPFHRDKTD